MIALDFIWDEAPIMIKIGLNLKKMGYDVIGITMGKRWEKLYIDNFETVNISEYFAKILSDEEIDYHLSRITATYYEKPLNFFFINDRLLKKIEYNNYRKLFVTSFLFWEEILEKFEITHTFCTGMAFMPLLVGNLVSNKKKKLFSAIMQPKDPQPRIFFSDHYENSFMFLSEYYNNLIKQKITINKLHEYNIVEKEILNVRAGKNVLAPIQAKHNWMYKNLSFRFLKEMYVRIKRNVFEGWCDKLDIVTPSILDLVKRHFLSFIKRQIIKFSNIFQQPDLTKKFIFYPLAVQPEVSSEIFSPWYTNQIELIKNIAISIPPDTTLYVKEHKPALGHREGIFKYYNSIKKIPNVVLISPNVNSYYLLKNSLVNIVIGGTAGWESLVLGKKPIVLGNIWYNLSNLTIKIKGFDELSFNIKKLIKNPNFNSNEEELFKIFFIASKFASYPGVFDIPLAIPYTLTKENIENLVNAIVNFYNKTKMEA